MTSETRYMRNSIQNNYNYPSDYTIIKGSDNAGVIGNLAASNNTYLVFDSETDGLDEVVEVEFEGTHSGHMPFLQERIELKASVSLSCRIQVYDYNAEAYPTTGTQHVLFALGTSDTNKYLYATTNMTYYRSSGAWKIKITATKVDAAGSTFQLSLDCMWYRTLYYELGTSRTSTCQLMSENVRNTWVGIRIFRVNSDDTETEITAGAPVATVYAGSSTTVLSNTYTPAETADCIAIIIRVYYGVTLLTTGDPISGGIPAVFMTEDLNSGVTLSNVQWTVYYSFTYLGWPFFITSYRFGASSCDSRITNFTWVPPTVAIPVGLNIPQVLLFILGDTM